jgi:hypothetical protein
MKTNESQKVDWKRLSKDTGGLPKFVLEFALEPKFKSLKQGFQLAKDGRIFFFIEKENFLKNLNEFFEERIEENKDNFENLKVLENWVFDIENKLDQKKFMKKILKEQIKICPLEYFKRLKKIVMSETYKEMMSYSYDDQEEKTYDNMVSFLEETWQHKFKLRKKPESIEEIDKLLEVCPDLYEKGLRRAKNKKIREEISTLKEKEELLLLFKKTSMSPENHLEIINKLKKFYEVE